MEHDASLPFVFRWRFEFMSFGVVVVQFVLLTILFKIYRYYSSFSFQFHLIGRNVSTRFSYFICGKGCWPSVFGIFERCKCTHSSRSSAIVSPIWNLQRLHTYFDYGIILCGVCVRNNDVIRICLDFNSISLFPIYTNIMTWTWTTSFINHIKCNPWNGKYDAAHGSLVLAHVQIYFFISSVRTDDDGGDGGGEAINFYFGIYLFFIARVYELCVRFFFLFDLFTYLFKKYFIVWAFHLSLVCRHGSDMD